MLGYIFERYVNRSDSGGDSEGAYYTKEDVTGYMAGVTIPSRVIDMMADSLDINPWSLLTVTPERYISTGLAFGVDESLPKNVAGADRGRAGILEEVADDSSIALPGERWREVVARRERFEWLRAHLPSGAVVTTDEQFP